MAARPGLEPVGIGIRGSAPTHSFPARGYSIVPSDGAFTRRSLFMALPIFTAVGVGVTTISAISTLPMDMVLNRVEAFAAALVAWAVSAAVVVEVPTVAAVFTVVAVTEAEGIADSDSDSAVARGRVF